MPASVPFDWERAIQIIADNKIRAAIEAGEFDHLPGLGKPSRLIDEPYDPLWWIKSKLCCEQLPAHSADGWLR